MPSDRPETPLVEPGQVKVWVSLNWPNRVSILRLLLVAPLVLLLLNQRQWPAARYGALAVFLVMGFSDYLDGVLARRLGERSRLGAILDPLADKVMIICSVILLSLPQSAVPGARIPNHVVVAVVGKDLWVIVGFIVVYLVTDRFRVRPTLAGKVSTAGQIVMVGLILIAPDLNRVVDSAGTWAAGLAAWGVAGLSVFAAISYTRLGLQFMAQEERPLDTHGRQQPPRHDAD